MSNDETFSTRDLYLAATLVTMGFDHINTHYQIEGIKRNPVGYFCFEDTDALHDAIRGYNQSKLVVEPKEFVTNMKSLKAEVINAYNSPHSRIYNK